MRSMWLFPLLGQNADHRPRCSAPLASSVSQMTPSSGTRSPSTCIPVSHIALFLIRPTHSLTTSPDAAILLLGSQISAILNFFLYKNIRIARDRAWDLTVASRGKGPDFWWPYVEEWDNPPRVDPDHRSFSEKWLGGFFGRYVVRKAIMVPFALYPVVGILASAWVKAVGTARYLHKQVGGMKR